MLGQVPLILGPSSWGAWMLNIPVVLVQAGVPPYYGRWGVNGGASGEVGPFLSADAALQNAMKEAVRHGARNIPMDGFARVVDQRGAPVGSTA